MDGDGFLEPATAERLRLAQTGADVARRLRAGELVPGDVGILEVEVRGVSPVRPYRRKRGGEGLLCRVSLADASGEVELVLWDAETRLAQDGPFRTGSRLRIAGAAVRAGYRGGIELGLGSAVVESVGRGSGVSTLAGVVVDLGETRPVADGGRMRFNADVVLDGPAGVVRVVAWDEALRALRQAGRGAAVALENVSPHPALEGWFVTTPQTTLRNG